MRKLRLLIALIAGLGTAAVLATPGIARATDYTELAIKDGSLCMGVQNGTMGPGTPVITWTCDGTDNQFWAMDPNSGAQNTFLLRNLADPTECLSVVNMALYLGAPLVIWPCKDVSQNQDQRWSRANVASAPIYNFNSGLQVLPSGPQGSAVVQWDGRVPFLWIQMDHRNG